MRRSNDTPRRVLIVLVVLVVVSGLLPAGVVKSVAHIPRQFFNPLLRAPALGLSRAMRDPSDIPPLDPATDLGNEAFRKLELLEAEAANAYLRLRVAELEKLVEDLGMIGGVLQGTSYRVLRADGLQIRRDRQRPQLTINRGSKDGVRKGDVVVGESVLQLVGIVDQVDRTACQVDLINAEDRSLQVEIVSPIASTNASTMQTLWVVWDEEVGAFVTDEPAKGYPVSVADLVYVRGGSLPEYARAFAIGQVAKVTPSPDRPDLQLRVVIRPLMQLDKITRVNVLVLDDDEAGNTANTAEGGNP